MDKTNSFDSLSEQEKKLVLVGLKGGPQKVHRYDHSGRGRQVRFGYVSDMHIGAKEFDWKLWSKMVSRFRDEKITTVYSPGDIVEGMSNRPGQIYDLEAIGFRAQVNLAAEAINMLGKTKLYSILGNHDLFFKDKSGVDANVGESLEQKCKNFIYLGDWEARIVLGKKVELMLYHANDGSAYALSYKLQKLAESLEGGKKPQIILSGHYHKHLTMFTRNIFGIECGTLCGQTQWMRGKKLAAHKGFGIIELEIYKKGGIRRLKHEFFPEF